MASREAVLRRRANRAAAKQAKEKKTSPAVGPVGSYADGLSLHDRWRAKQVRDSEIACRRARRRYPSRGTGFVAMPLIVLDYRYVQALRAGIDMLAPAVWDGASDPRDTPAWRFWCSLHYETRLWFALDRHRDRGRRAN